MAEPLNEKTIIAEILAPLATAPGALGLADDAALVRCPAGHELVISQDTLIAGVHFHDTDPADLIAAKALRVNLSDLAAKGAAPLAYFLSLGLAPNQTLDWVRDFAAGLAGDQREFGLTLYGGDTVSAPGGPMITITVIGTCPQGAMVPRSGANSGDHLYVSGTIGDSALGLLEVQRGATGGPLAQRYLVPQPRLGLAIALRDNASAAMDISDGLVVDLGRMMQASRCSAQVECEAVPLSPAARALIGTTPELFDRALTGGDDYEIVCAVAPRQVKAFEAASRQAGIMVTKIGQVTAGNAPLSFVDAKGSQRNITDYSHAHFARF
ncbi:MAG: thiamine-phosphate kinase [Alphaproteobacteria bacterium]